MATLLSLRSRAMFVSLFPAEKAPESTITHFWIVEDIGILLGGSLSERAAQKMIDSDRYTDK